jgi:excisionase family DNA binding protein
VIHFRYHAETSGDTRFAAGGNAAAQGSNKIQNQSRGGRIQRKRVLDCMKSTLPISTDTIVSTLRSRTNYLSGTEVMFILGISRNTLCQQVRDGAIPAYKFGKNYRYDPALLAGWIEARQM